jgi:hypothetical protein
MSDIQAYAVGKAEKKFPTIYSVFWMWAKGNGYDVAMGDMRKAWTKYRETEMSETDKNVFSGHYEDEIKDKYNEYCASRILQEREARKEIKL